MDPISIAVGAAGITGIIGAVKILSSATKRAGVTTTPSPSSLGDVKTTHSLVGRALAQTAAAEAQRAATKEIAKQNLIVKATQNEQMRKVSAILNPATKPKKTSRRSRASNPVNISKTGARKFDMKTKKVQRRVYLRSNIVKKQQEKINESMKMLKEKEKELKGSLETVYVNESQCDIFDDDDMDNSDDDTIEVGRPPVGTKWIPEAKMFVLVEA